MSSPATTHDRGAVLTEAAIVLPLLLMLTLGIWTTARAWNVHNTLDHAVREAARFGATEVPWTDSSPAMVRAVADQQLAAASISPFDVTTDCVDKGTDPCGLGATSTDQVAVALLYPDYQLDFVFFSITVDLGVSAVARWEGT